MKRSALNDLSSHEANGESSSDDFYNTGHASKDSQINDLKDRIAILQKKHQQEKENLNNEINEYKELAISRKNELNDCISQYQSQIEEENKKNKAQIKELNQLKMATNSFFAILSTKASKPIDNFDDALSFINNLNISLISKADRISQLESECESMKTSFSSLSSNLSHSKSKNSHLKEKIKSAIEKIKIDSESTISNLSDSLKDTRRKNKQLKKIINGQSQQIKQLKQHLEDYQSQSSSIQATNDSHPESAISILEAQNAMNIGKLENSNQEIKNLNVRINELEIQNHDLSSQLSLQERNLNNMREDNEKLTKAYDSLNDKYKSASRENLEMKDQIMSKDMEIAVLDTNLRETKIEYENLLAQRIKESTFSSVQSSKSDFDRTIEFNEAFASISSLLENQSIEIQKIQKQRSELVQQLQNADRYISFNESTIRKLTNENENLENQYQTFVKQTKITNNKNDKEFSDAFADILPLIPKDIYIDVSQYESLPKSQILTKTITKLINYMKTETKTNHSINDIKNSLDNSSFISNEEDPSNLRKVEQLTKLNQTLLSHLDNANRFLKKLSATNDCQDHEIILKECTRIGRFINETESKIEPTNYLNHPSVFDPYQFKDATDLLLQFISEGQCNESPFKELIILFNSVIQANLLLTNRCDENKMTINFLQQKAETYQKESEALSQFEEWKREHEKQLDIVYHQVSQLLDEPQGGVNDMINQIAHEKETLKAEIAQLQSNISTLQEKVDSAKSSEHNTNKKFYRRADRIIEHIEQNVKDRTEEYLETINDLESKLHKAAQENADLNQHYQEKMQKSNKKIIILKESMKELSKTKDEIKNQLEQNIEELNADLSNMDEKIHNYEESIDQYQQKIQHLTAKKLLYKEKYQKLSAQDAQLLKDINQRREELSGKYDETIAKLEIELNETRNLKEQAENEVASFSSYKTNLQRQNASLLLSERTLKMKNNNLLEQIENERQNFLMKENSLKMALQNQFSQQTSHIVEENDKMRSFISTFSERAFGISINPKSDFLTITQIFNKAAENKFKSHEMKEINSIVKLRTKYDLDEKVSIFDFVTELDEKLNNTNQIQAKYEEQLNKLKAEYELLNVECNKLDNVRRENTQWKDWSRSIMRQFYKSASTDSSNEYIRTQIEEILLSSVSQRKLLNKVDTLRREKALLLSRPQFLVPPPRKSTTKSIRPILLVLACAHRLRDRV